MSLSKITDAQTTGKWIDDLSDTPDLGTDLMQQAFDYISRYVIIPAFNTLTDELQASTGAGAIGAAVAGVSGENTAAILTALKAMLDDRYTKNESDTLLGTNTHNLVESVEIDLQTGVFTITKADGTVKKIDTAIEKVALDARLEGSDFVLTLADGTKQRVDIGKFIDTHTFSDSDTVAFSSTGAENNKVITARVKDHSIKLSMLALDAVSKIEGDVLAAANSAAAALASQNAAANSATAAGTHKTGAEAAKQAAGASQLAAGVSESAAESSRTAAAASAAGAASDAVRARTEADRAKEEADKAAAIVGGDFVTRSEISEHTDSRNNPHGVTAAQVGAPTKTSQLTNNSNFVADANYVHTDNNYNASAKAEVAKVAAKATTVTYSTTFAAANWTAGTSPYAWQQSVSVAGMLAADNPVVGQLFLGTTADAIEAEREAMGCITRVTTAAGNITALCLTDKPTVEIKIQMKVVR